MPYFPYLGILSADDNKTTNPLLTVSLSSNTYTAKIQNKYNGTATLYENANVTPPTTSRGSVSYNTTVNGDTINKLAGGTFYAKAKASGLLDSNIVSYTLDPSF